MTTRRCLRIGLTGGIGSGKSTVSAMWSERGAAVLDADAISRASTSSGGGAISTIAEVFGPQYIDVHGALDRSLMRSLVFSEPAARARLEAIVHPIVLQTIAQEEDRARKSGARLIVMDIPLLVESGRWARAVDAVVLIDCTSETQIGRVAQRSNMLAPQIQAIIDAQATRAQRRAVADAVLWNDGISLAQLGANAAGLAKTFGL